MRGVWRAYATRRVGEGGVQSWRFDFYPYPGRHRSLSFFSLRQRL